MELFNSYFDNFHLNKHVRSNYEINISKYRWK